MDENSIKIDITKISNLITEVQFCNCFNSDNCKRPTIYILHKRKEEPNYYHCLNISRDGLMVNSNGYHPLDVHDAMNEALKVARYHLGL